MTNNIFFEHFVQLIAFEKKIILNIIMPFIRIHSKKIIVMYFTRKYYFNFSTNVYFNVSLAVSLYY